MNTCEKCERPMDTQNAIVCEACKTLKKEGRTRFLKRVGSVVGAVVVSVAVRLISGGKIKFRRGA